MGCGSSRVEMEKIPCYLEDVYFPNSECRICGRKGDLTIKRCKITTHGKEGFVGCLDCWNQCYTEQPISEAKKSEIKKSTKNKEKTVTKPCELEDVFMPNFKCNCGEEGALTIKKCFKHGAAGCLDCFKQCHDEVKVE